MRVWSLNPPPEPQQQAQAKLKDQQQLHQTDSKRAGRVGEQGTDAKLNSTLNNPKSNPNPKNNKLATLHTKAGTLNPHSLLNSQPQTFTPKTKSVFQCVCCQTQHRETLNPQPQSQALNPKPDAPQPSNAKLMH